jgi:hypothetical protein
MRKPFSSTGKSSTRESVSKSGTVPIWYLVNHHMFPPLPSNYLIFKVNHHFSPLKDGKTWGFNSGSLNGRSFQSAEILRGPETRGSAGKQRKLGWENHGTTWPESAKNMKNWRIRTCRGWLEELDGWFMLIFGVTKNCTQSSALDVLRSSSCYAHLWLINVDYILVCQYQISTNYQDTLYRNVACTPSVWLVSQWFGVVACFCVADRGLVRS